MTTTVIAYYDNADKAQQVLNALGNAGHDKKEIDVFSKDGGAPNREAIIGKLTRRGIPSSEAGILAEAIGRGGVLVALESADEKADEVLTLLNRHGARNLEEIEAQIQGGQQQGRTEARETVPVVEEQISVGKRRVLRGGVRVTTTVKEQPFQETVKLREESVDVDRHGVDRTISPEEADKAFQEKSVELTETAEEAVVSKQAHVVEEVALRKTAAEREEKVEDKTRRTEVKVEEIEPKARPEGKR